MHASVLWECLLLFESILITQGMGEKTQRHSIYGFQMEKCQAQCGLVSNEPVSVLSTPYTTYLITRLREHPAPSLHSYSASFFLLHHFTITTVSHEKKPTLNTLWKELMLKLKPQYFGHLMRRADSLEKTLVLGKIEGRRRKG